MGEYSKALSFYEKALEIWEETIAPNHPDLAASYNNIGLIVDRLGNVYVTDSQNHRIMRWLKGSKEGTIVVGGNEYGNQPMQFAYPKGLSFDQQGNLYVVDAGNHRVQKFDIDLY